MGRALIAAFIAGAVTACVSNAPAASPTATTVVAASPTSTPVATTLAPSPTATGRHVNAVLGYAVTLPPPWRVSDCLSGITQDPTYVGSDVLTWRTAAEEQTLGVSGGTGPTGAFSWVVTIEAQVTPQSPMQFAVARGGTGNSVESITLDGKPAARAFDVSGNSLGYYVAGSGRMYGVTLVPGSDPRPPQMTNAAFDAIARSVMLVTPAARPTPSPPPVMSAAVETVVDAVTAAFAASDVDRLRDLIRPTCWFTSGYWQSEGTSTSRDNFVAGLRTAFAQGLKVNVEPRPIRSAPIMRGSFWVWSAWSEYGLPPRVTRASNVQLVFDQIDGHWYLVGALFNAER